jgi:hypothetical protein
MSLHPGRTVVAYTDPITQNDRIGECELIKCIKTLSKKPNLQEWEVEFKNGEVRTVVLLAEQQSKVVDDVLADLKKALLSKLATKESDAEHPPTAKDAAMITETFTRLITTSLQIAGVKHVVDVCIECVHEDEDQSMDTMSTCGVFAGYGEAMGMMHQIRHTIRNHFEVEEGEGDG